MTTTGPDPRFDALAELALGTLPEEQRAELERWIASEPSAQAQLRAIREALAALTVSVAQVEPPAHLRARVLAIAGQTGAVADPAALDRSGAAAGAAATAPTASDVPARAWWSTTGWLAAAAATIVAIGLGVYAGRLQGDLARLEARLQDTSARLAAAEAEARDDRARLVRVQAETAILSAADLRRVDLAGQTPAPGARARAFWSRAQGLVLTAARLPRLPQGRTYQLWVLTSGAPVSAGTFDADASGGASAVFDTPVGLPTPTGLAVSIEPAGGVPAPTGDIILVGKAD